MFKYIILSIGFLGISNIVFANEVNPTDCSAPGGAAVADIDMAGFELLDSVDGSVTISSGDSLDINGSIFLDEDALWCVAPITDTAPDDLLIHSGHAYSQGSQTASDLILSGGLDEKLITVDDRTESGDNDTLVITVNGSGTTITADTDFTCSGAASEAACACNLYAYIIANPITGITPGRTDGTCSDAKVFFQPANGDTFRLNSAVTDGGGGTAYATVTNGTDGLVSMEGHVDLQGLYQVIFDDDNDSYCYASADDTIVCYVAAGLMSTLDANGFLSGANITAEGSSYFNWALKSEVTSPNDGTILMTNDAGTDFTMLQFGCTANTCPAWKRNSANFQARNAADTGYIDVTVRNIQATANVLLPTAGDISYASSTDITAPADGDLLITKDDGVTVGTLFSNIDLNGTERVTYDANADSYCYASADDVIDCYVAAGLMSTLDASGLTLAGDLDINGQQVLLETTGNNSFLYSSADNTVDLYVDNALAVQFISTGTALFQNDVRLNATDFFYWVGRSEIYSPADGDILISNAAGTDFGMLYFGDNTVAFPALKRSGDDLLVRLGDDSGPAGLQVGTLATFSTASFTGDVVYAPSTTESIVAGTGITTTNRAIVRIAGSGGAVTVTATPSITARSDGSCITIQGDDDTNTVTLQDNDTLAGTNLELSGSVSMVFGKGDMLHLCYDSGDTKWYEVSRSDN